MFRKFLSNNSRSILIIGVLISIWLILYFFNKDHTKRCLNNPVKGQIYIFQEDNYFAPMRLDSVGDTKLYMRNYIYLFEEAIPRKNQILKTEFDLNFYAIYDKIEIQRLYDIGNLVKIYP